MWIRAFFLALFLLAGCSAFSNQAVGPGVSDANLGKVITVEGRAVNCKIGAQLIGAGFDLWIDGLSSWPEGYCNSGDGGKKIKVSGILAEDNALPVFIPRKGEPVVQGIPVPEGTDLKKASHRYILRDARWELLRQ
jgi:hypothetical protein